jgi:hypothetical protein
MLLGGRSRIGDVDGVGGSTKPLPPQKNDYKKESTAKKRERSAE